MNGPLPTAWAAKAVHACLLRAALSPALAGTASYCFCHAVGETINRLVMLYGSSASGSEVVSATVWSSIFSAPVRVGMRDRVLPICPGAYCGAALFSTLSTFQTMASAFTSVPSWNLTPGRKVKIQRLVFCGSMCHSVASPGTRPLGFSPCDRSHSTSASYSGMPVKRLPS